MRNQRRASSAQVEDPARHIAERAEVLNQDASTVAGAAGPGRWLVCRYIPTTPFALKMSQATSSVGKTLLVPTNYAIKMALVDAAFRMGLADERCAAVLRSLVMVDVRVAPPPHAVVTHTFVKIRQEPKKADPLRPYGSSIAYREIVCYAGEWQWAFDLAGCDEALTALLSDLLAHVCYIGQRGSFVQLMGSERQPELGIEFTQPQAEAGFVMPERWHIAQLDDFGPEASLEVLSTYSGQQAKRDRHRRYVQTIVPLGLVNTGPGFSEYARE
jgi:hypothetical protein